MGIPNKIKNEFLSLTPNYELLGKHYRANQKEYIRIRFKAVKLLWDGNSENEVAEKLDVHRNTLQEWMKTIIQYGVEQGLLELSREKHTPRTHKLSTEQEKAIIEISETQTPNDYGYSINVFTCKILAEIAKKNYQIEVSESYISHMYHRHGYSYQRAHRDYEEASPEKQIEYLSVLKKL